jgi:hypothetical protein
MYDVYWLARWLLILWGSKYLEHFLGSELNISLGDMNTEQQNRIQQSIAMNKSTE